jgi:DNA-binding beta-propeller fold protein YncE
VFNDGEPLAILTPLAGFTVDANGKLHNIFQGIPLSVASIGPAEVSFAPEGNQLIVTEKNTNNVDVFALDSKGNVTGMKIMASAAETPFGFAFGRHDILIVSDTVGSAVRGAVLIFWPKTGRTPL